MAPKDSLPPDILILVQHQPMVNRADLCNKQNIAAMMEYDFPGQILKEIATSTFSLGSLALGEASCQLPCQAAQWRRPCDEELSPHGDGHASEPIWKQTLQPPTFRCLGTPLVS